MAEMLESWLKSNREKFLWFRWGAECWWDGETWSLVNVPEEEVILDSFIDSRSVAKLW